MFTRLLLALVALACLSGCFGDQAQKQTVKFDDPSRVAVPPPAAPVAHPTLPQAEIVPLPPSITHEEFTTSQNAVSQGFTGMGAQIGKVADRFEASLAHVESNVNLQSTATAKAIAKFSLNFENKIKMQNKAIVRLGLKLDAVAQAQGTAQAAIGSKLESVQQTTSAGRDSTQIQFTREQRDCFISMFHETIAIVAILGLVMVLLQHHHHNSTLKMMGGKQCEPQSPSQLYRSV